jgi:hypothetical protein
MRRPSSANHSMKLARHRHLAFAADSASGLPCSAVMIRARVRTESLANRYFAARLEAARSPAGTETGATPCLPSMPCVP